MSLPLTEFQVPFTVSRQEIRDIQRGAADVDLADLDRAARHAAEIENRAIFHGWPAAGITGVAGASSLRPLELGEDPDTYPSVVARAVDALPPVRNRQPVHAGHWSRRFHPHRRGTEHETPCSSSTSSVYSTARSSAFPA